MQLTLPMRGRQSSSTRGQRVLEGHQLALSRSRHSASSSVGLSPARWHTSATISDDWPTPVGVLESSHGEIKRMARERLGRLYCEADYPATFVGLFSSLGASKRGSHPAIWPVETRVVSTGMERVRARFEEAVSWRNKPSPTNCLG